MSSEWRQTRLSDLVDIKHGFAFKGEFFSDEPTLYQLTTPGNFAIGGGFQLGKGKFYKGPVPNDYVLCKDDLLVTMTDLSKAADTLGYAALVPEAHGTIWLHNQRVGLVTLKPNTNLNKMFLHYVMRTPDYRHWVVSTATGSTVKHTSPTRILDYQFLLPPKSTQHAIGEALSALDDRINVLRETNTTLEAIAQALFKSWFVDFDPVHAKMQGRVPEGMDEATAALFPDGFEESELGLVPKGWTIQTLSQICKIASGNRPNLRSDVQTENALIPLFGGAGIMGFTNQALFEVEKIVTGRVGTLGKVHIAYPPFWASDNVLVVSPTERSSFHFCLHWIHSIDVHSLNRGSTQPLLTQKDLGKQVHPFPTANVLESFATVTDATYKKIKSNEEQAQTLATLRDTLLPRLISGQLRVNIESN